MKTLNKIVLLTLILLTIASGVAKVMLTPQEVSFFGAFGFSNAVIVALGVIQILAAVMMALPKFRFYGALIIIVTFLISLILLIKTENYPMAAITFFVTLLVAWIAKSNYQLNSQV